MNDRDERELEERIRQRAYRLWEDEGCPEGRSDVHWDRATELVAIEDNQRQAMEPVPSPSDLGPSGEPVEPIEAVENAGEFPTMTDQGEQMFPARRPDPVADETTHSAAPDRRTASSPNQEGASRQEPQKSRRAAAKPANGQRPDRTKPRGAPANRQPR